MYVVESRLTGRLVYPQHLGRIKKTYTTRIEASADVERLAPIVNPRRVDVVELSRSALAWLEQYRQALRVHKAPNA